MVRLGLLMVLLAKMCLELWALVCMCVRVCMYVCMYVCVCVFFSEISDGPRDPSVSLFGPSVRRPGGASTLRIQKSVLSAELTHFFGSGD